ncbi:MAG: hypothetical protein JSS72_02950 [Armatimonadetes bacterium]|nr:hypothetical protein [Armatimonadota bacterium]
MRNLAALLLALSVTTALAAPKAPRIPAYKFKTPPVIDGVVNDSEWAQAPKGTEFYEEATGAPAPETGEYWIGYDDKFVYFAARFKDSQPKTIRAVETRQAVDLSAEDFVSFWIDPMNSGQNMNGFNVFRMNAVGGTDIAIAGGRAAKTEWLGEIQTKGRITADGWEVEARIPWKIMRLPKSGLANMQVHVNRAMPRYGRDFTNSFTSQGQVLNYNAWTIPDLPSFESKEIKLLPYVSGGYDRDQHALGKAGMDVRTPITPTVDYVGTIEPDFRNVEGAILGVDFSYFERLANESRPFFLEGQGYFGTSGDDPIFVSQRIHKFDIGSKIIGAPTTSSTIGILDTISFKNEHDFVANYQDLIGPNTRITAAISNRAADDGNNAVTFLGYRTNKGPFSIYTQLSHSKDTTSGGGERFNPGIAYNNNGLSAFAEYTQISPDYNAALGFVPLADISGFKQYAEYYHPFQKGPFQSIDFGGINVDFKNFDRSGPVLREQDFWTNFTLRRVDVQFGFNGTFAAYQGNRDRFFGGYVTFPSSNQNNQVSISLNKGVRNDEGYQLAQLSANFRPVKPAKFSLAVAQLILGNQVFNQQILSGSYLFDNVRSLNFRTTKQGRDVNTYVGYKRSGAKGIEYFLIFGDPNATKTRTSVLLKVTYPIEL